MSDIKYLSSIINKYGDRDKVPQDCMTIFNILDRQGSSLLIDSLAEYIEKSASKLGLSDLDRSTLIDNVVLELQDALKERL